MNQSDPSPPQRPSGRFQFRLATLLLAMGLVSVPAALLGGFLGEGENGHYSSRLVLLTLMAPVGLIVFFGLIRLLMRPRQRRRKW
ncbi:MAG: hypothetical protein WBF93_20850 [Pirellulales bacterium]|nr:hypothetical protein [Pirellulales bacterium]